MSSFLLPPQTNFALPGTDDAIRLGCTCPGSVGKLAGLETPTEKVGQRPRFGAPKAFYYFYSINCVLHGGAVRYALEQPDIAIEPAT